MRIKKHFGLFTVIFDMLSDDYIIHFEKELEDIFLSIENATLIDRRIPYDDLIKIQQKNPKHILIPSTVKLFDDIRLLIKLVNNFLIATNQNEKFMIETLIFHGEDEIIAYGSEIYPYPTTQITFSPTARLSWSNPQLINKIIDVG